MPSTRKPHPEQTEEQSAQKRLSHPIEGARADTPIDETALPQPVAAAPVAFLTSSQASGSVNARLRARALVQLQRQRGNAYVRRLLRARTIQTRLTISSPGDQHEQEADRVAELVTQRIGAGPQLQHDERETVRRWPLQSQPGLPLDRQVQDEEEEEEEELQPKRESGVEPSITPDLETRIERARSGGQALDGSTQVQMESALGTDLSRVRVHTDREADRLSTSLQAEAFTTGQHIFFRSGTYQPGSVGGRKLLAHELTHVLQQSPGPAPLIQRHLPEGGCATPEACAAMRQTLLGILNGVDRQQGQSWQDAWEPIRSFIEGLSAEETLSLRTMLGEIGNNPDTGLQSAFEEHLWPAWQQRILTWLRQRTDTARQEAAASLEEEPVQWGEEAEQAEAPATDERRPERGRPRATGRVVGTQLVAVESAGETFRVGDLSGSWQIIGIVRDWQGVVTVRVRNRRTREEQGWSLQDWHVQLSIAHVIRSTEAMAAIAEAETRILYELALPAWIRVPAEMAWIGVVWYTYRRELESIVDRVAQLNPALDWLHQHAPASVQTFLAQRAAVSVGEAVPSGMDPVEIGREIGRALRTARSLIYLVISITRVARGSVTAGVSASLRAFTGVGAVVGARTLENLGHMFRDFTGLLALHGLRNVRPGAEALAREEAIGLIADWGRERGLTLDNQIIDQLITENTSEETGRRLLEVLDVIRDFIELSTAVADAIDHQRPTPVSSPE